MAYKHMKGDSDIRAKTEACRKKRAHDHVSHVYSSLPINHQDIYICHCELDNKIIILYKQCLCVCIIISTSLYPLINIIP